MLTLQLHTNAERHLALLAEQSGKTARDYAKEAVLVHLWHGESRYECARYFIDDVVDNNDSCHQISCLIIYIKH